MTNLLGAFNDGSEPSLFYEDGIPLANGLMKPESVHKLRNFDFKEGDGLIASLPKAGTTLTQEIMWLVMHDGDIEGADEEYTDIRIPFLERAVPPSLKLQKDNKLLPLELFERQTPPRLGKTHLPWQLGPDNACAHGAKVIYVIRDPKDILVSQYYFAQGFKGSPFKGSFDDFFEIYMSNPNSYGNIFDHCAGYWKKRHNPNVLFIFYEDLLENKRDGVIKIAEFLGKDISSICVDRIVEATSFKSMQSNPMTNMLHTEHLWGVTSPPFMRKGIAGDWRNHFNANQKAQIDEQIVDKLRSIGITKY